MYALGQGVSKNYKSALEWYHKAAEQGFAEAQRNLGAMYAEGVGTQTDLVQACKWFNLAVIAGYQNAGKDLTKVEDKMSREQVDKARQLAQEWLGKQKISVAGLGA